MSLAIRLTYAYDTIKEVIEKLKDHCSAIAVYEHQADEEVSRTHIHALVVDCKVSTDTIKNWVRKVIGAVDKNDWSFKTAAKNTEEQYGFIVYMTKGVLEPVYSSGYDTALLDQAKSKWVDPKAISVKAKDGKLVKDIDESNTVSKRKILEAIIAEVGDTEYDTRTILAGIRKVLIRYNCVIGQYKVIDYYDAYMMYAQKDKWIDTVAFRIDKRDSQRNI